MLIQEKSVWEVSLSRSEAGEQGTLKPVLFIRPGGIE
jgi:hypothetical protein